MRREAHLVLFAIVCLCVCVTKVAAVATTTGERLEESLLPLSLEALDVGGNFVEVAPGRGSSTIWER